MDFSKIVDQRQAKATVTDSAETDQMLEAALKRVMANSKPGPKPKATSKRNSPEWAPSTMFLSVETKAALERYLNLSKLDARPGQSHPNDQSELVDAALKEWLAKHLPKLEAEVIGR